MLKLLLGLFLIIPTSFAYGRIFEFVLMDANSSKSVPRMKRTSDGQVFLKPCPTFAKRGVMRKYREWQFEKFSSEPGDGCFYYECRGHFGFASATDRKCVTCPTSRPKDSVTGICGGCPAGTTYDAKQHYCADNTPTAVSHETMRQCAPFTQADEYRICVMGCPSGQKRQLDAVELSPDLQMITDHDYVKCIDL